jgi:nicotinamidase-related amidase
MNTALLVIDVQHGAFDGARYPPVVHAAQFLANALLLLSAARDAGWSRIFIQHCGGDGEVLEEGTPHGEIHPALGVQAAETIIRKYESSAFDGTDLARLLERRAVSHLVVCGLQSQYCVYDTAVGALRRGYAVTVAADGHTTWPAGGESAAAIRTRINERLRADGATLASSAALAGAIRSGRNLSASP